MDCFFTALPLTRKTRLHFHEFMREVHRELAEMTGTSDPLQHLGKSISQRFRLICLDEFHVADITDAMILHRLLESLFAEPRQHRHDIQFPPRRSLPERAAPRAHAAGDRAAQGKARGRQRRRPDRLPAVDAAGGRALSRAARRGRRRGDDRGVRAPRRGQGREPGAEDRASRDPRSAPRRRRGLVRLSRSCAAGRDRRTTISSWRPSSTPCCSRACRRCRHAWRRRRAASPG